MCPYSELLGSEFYSIRTKYNEILRISPYLVQMWENEDQNNSEYGSFSGSVSAILPGQPISFSYAHTNMNT